MGGGIKAGSIIKRGEDNYRVIGVLKEFHFNPVNIYSAPKYKTIILAGCRYKFYPGISAGGIQRERRQAWLWYRR